MDSGVCADSRTFAINPRSCSSLLFSLQRLCECELELAQPQVNATVWRRKKQATFVHLKLFNTLSKIDDVYVKMKLTTSAFHCNTEVDANSTFLPIVDESAKGAFLIAQQ